MYRELYELLNKQGRVKRSIFLDGIYKGEFMTEHHRAGDFWYPYLKEIEKIEETKILDTEKGRIFVEILEKNPHLVILGGRTCFLSCGTHGKNAGISCNRHGRQGRISYEREIS